MMPCPPDDRWLGLLDDQLGPDEYATLEGHLETCEGCQATLERLTVERESGPSWRPLADLDADADGLAASTFDGLGPVDPSTSRVFRSTASRRSASKGPAMARASAEADPSSDARLAVDGYDILGRLGQGGMGVVYRARQHGLDRLVALKMLRGGGHASSESLARFQIEVRAAARLRHPNVVHVYDVGESHGLPFVALELLEGGSLDARNAGVPQPERPSAELVATIARAIAEAHRAGVIHRDLKPANVLFARDGTPKVADFGLAKRLDEEDGQTHSGQVMGSPSFMAPEQARGQGKEVGPAADIYSLGAILYEMLTGRPPFKGGSSMETLFQVVNEEPVDPTRLRPGLSRDLATICLKCLSKEPGHRFATADDLADDLNRHLAGAPILARPVGYRERAWKWARREPAAASLLAAAALSVVVASATAIHFAAVGREHDQRIARARTAGLLAISRAEATLADPQAVDPRLADAQDALTEFLAESGGDPSVLDLSNRASGLISRINANKAGRDRSAQVARDLERFRRLKRDAQVAETRFAAVGRLDDPRVVRQAARDALAIFGRFDRVGEADAWRPSTFPPSLSSADRVEVARGCRELVLIWAEALARPSPSESPEARARVALASLARSRIGANPSGPAAPSKLAPKSKADLLLESRLLDQSGDPDLASKARASAEATPSVDALDRVMWGREAQRREDWAGSIAEFEAALRVEPRQFRAQLLLAISELQAGRPDLSRANLTNCLARDPGSAHLRLLHGVASGEEARRRMGRLGAADRVETPEVEALFEGAEADFRQALDSNPDDEGRYAILVNRGVVRLVRDRADQAIDDLALAESLCPEKLAAHVALGQAYARVGRADDARAQFARGIAVDPGQPAPYRGRALAGLDRDARPSTEALAGRIDDLSKAIALEPTDASEAAADRSRRARLLFLSGRFADALADATDALKIDPNNLDAPIIRIKALLELKHYREVVAACDEALSRPPVAGRAGRQPSADLHELRGAARSQTHDPQGAIDDLTQALGLDPGRASARLKRGWAYLVSDAPRLAEADFSAVIAGQPGNADALGGRGYALAMLGRHHEATLDADESIRRGGPDVEARTTYNAARIYARAASGLLDAGTRHGPAALSQAMAYQDRAQALVVRALESMPSARRPAFWADVVQGDPALVNLRQRPKFSQLVNQVGSLVQ